MEGVVEMRSGPLEKLLGMKDVDTKVKGVGESPVVALMAGTAKNAGTAARELH